MYEVITKTTNNTNVISRDPRNYLNCTMSQIKNDHSNFLLSNCKTKVREIRQPVRLVQGLSGKKSQDDQRNPTIKLSQPERLTPYGKRGSCKKNPTVTLTKPERLTPYLKSAQKSCKKDTFLQHDTTNARRNLNFYVNNSPKRKKTKLHDRRSFLLPPNTIKETYIKERQSTFILPQCQTLATTSKIKSPRSSDETCSSSTKNVCFNIIHEKSNATPVVQHTLLRIPDTIDESGVLSIACSSPACAPRNKNVQKKLNSDKDFCITVCVSPKITNSLQFSESNANKVTKEGITKETYLVNEIEKFARTVNNQEENAHSSRMIKMTTDGCVLSPCNNNGPDELVTLRKTDLTALELKLASLIGRLKEDLSELTAFANTISKINAASELNDKDEKKKRKTTENLNAIIEIPERDNNNLEMQVGLEINKENENSNNIKCSENDIKFKTRRRSARLMAKSLNNLCNSNSNDSFVNLENELNITHANSNVKYTPVKNCKYPDVTKYKKINGKPMKEYLALKSRMSCLLTPKTPKSYSSSNLGHICHENGNAKASISNKLFSELNNLYADSPDSV